MTNREWGQIGNNYLKAAEYDYTPHRHDKNKS
jgi:hypothetical protein